MPGELRDENARVSAVFLGASRLTRETLPREKTSAALTLVVSRRAERCLDDFRCREVGRDTDFRLRSCKWNACELRGNGVNVASREAL